MLKKYNDNDLQNFVRQVIGNVDSRPLLEAANQHGSRSALSPYDEELAKRTLFRFFNEEVRRQQNLEDVFEFADEELSKNQERAAKTVDENWAYRFVNLAKDITENDLKRYWGRLLAGEIESPGTFSYRILLLLSQLSRNEIERIKIIFRYALFSDVYEKAQILKTKDYDPIGMSDLLFMQDLGLISTEKITLNYKDLNYGAQNYLVFYRNGIGIVFSTNKRIISFPIHKLTNIGRELLLLSSDVDVDIDCLRTIARATLKEQTGSISAKCGKIFVDADRWHMDELIFEMTQSEAMNG